MDLREKTHLSVEEKGSSSPCLAERLGLPDDSKAQVVLYKQLPKSAAAATGTSWTTLLLSTILGACLDSLAHCCQVYVNLQAALAAPSDLPPLENELRVLAELDSLLCCYF